MRVTYSPASHKLPSAGTTRFLTRLVLTQIVDIFVFQITVVKSRKERSGQDSFHFFCCCFQSLKAAPRDLFHFSVITFVSCLLLDICLCKTLKCLIDSAGVKLLKPHAKLVPLEMGAWWPNESWETSFYGIVNEFIHVIYLFYFLECESAQRLITNILRPCRCSAVDKGKRKFSQTSIRDFEISALP